MFKIGVLVSGGGTNLQAIIDRIEDGTLPNIQIATVISNVENAYALTRAKNHNIDNIFIDAKKYESKEKFELELIRYFESKGVELIVLAGFHTILTSTFINAYKNKIINVHPALIPAFSGQGYYGLKTHEAALERGVKVVRSDSTFCY